MLQTALLPDVTPLYVGYDDVELRHISLVPYMPGLEAVCGEPLRRTAHPGPWRAVIGAVTCPACRGIGVGFVSTGALAPAVGPGRVR
ncbi:hypothetical protein GCM10027265_04990 [Jatrophihabitans fulvus]